MVAVASLLEVENKDTEVLPIILLATPTPAPASKPLGSTARLNRTTKQTRLIIVPTWFLNYYSRTIHRLQIMVNSDTRHLHVTIFTMPDVVHTSTSARDVRKSSFDYDACFGKH